MRGAGKMKGEVFVCWLKLEGGEVCGKKFKQKKDLILHQTQTKGGEHGPQNSGGRSVVWSAVLCNQCPVCLTVHRSRRTTRQHLRNSYEKRALQD